MRLSSPGFTPNSVTSSARCSEQIILVLQFKKTRPGGPCSPCGPSGPGYPGSPGSPGKPGHPRSPWGPRNHMSDSQSASNDFILYEMLL